MKSDQAFRYIPQSLLSIKKNDRLMILNGRFENLENMGNNFLCERGRPAVCSTLVIMVDDFLFFDTTILLFQNYVIIFTVH